MTKKEETSDEVVSEVVKEVKPSEDAIRIAKRMAEKELQPLKKSRPLK